MFQITDFKTLPNTSVFSRNKRKSKLYIKKADLYHIKFNIDIVEHPNKSGFIYRLLWLSIKLLPIVVL